MRLITKLIALLILGICAVLSVDGYLTVRREVHLFEADIRRDAQVLGRILDVAIGEVWTTQGEKRALELIEHADRAIADLHLRWVWRDREEPGHIPHFPAALARAIDSRAPVAAEGSSENDRMLFTYVAPQFDAGRRGALEIGGSLAQRDAYTSETTRRIALVVGATIAVCALLAIVLGVWVVGNPVQQLVTHARAIGAGDLERRLQMRQRDEIGELASEMNTMSLNLLEARRRIEAETEQRLRAVEHLRHADRLSTAGQLSAGMAHELGTPLNVVSQRAAMIERKELTGEDALDSARVIREQSERMARIIRQLLDFTRRRTPHKIREDLARIARDTLSLVAPFAGKRRVTLELVCRDEPVEAEIDGELMRQALTNLVVNAIQASSAGEPVRILLGRRSTTPPAGIDLAQGTFAYASVVDWGTGVARDDLEHVFEPFFTTKGVGEGTGLGLSVAYGIVRDHSGWIDVQSDDDTTRFTVFLPEPGNAPGDGLPSGRP